MKQLVLAFGLGLGLFSPLALAQWDVVDNREDIAIAAHDLSDAAEHFHEVIHDIAGYSHLAMDVHRFARISEHFHDSVENGAPVNHMRRDFLNIQNSTIMFKWLSHELMVSITIHMLRMTGETYGLRFKSCRERCEEYRTLMGMMVGTHITRSERSLVGSFFLSI